MANHNDRIDMQLGVGLLLPPSFLGADPGAAASTHSLSVPMVRVRRGKEVRLIIDGVDAVSRPAPDPALIKLLATAFAARDAINTAGKQTLAEVAKAQGYAPDYFSLLLRLSMLAPDIVEAIYDGRQLPALNRQRLARTTNLPIEWSAQRAALGFG